MNINFEKLNSAVEKLNRDLDKLRGPEEPIGPGGAAVMPVEGYEKLADVLGRAYHQAARGKGNDRHAGGKPFHQQPMQVISELLDTDGFMAGQAIKKIHEARGLPTREHRIAELLGAINYIAGMVIFEESQPADNAGAVPL